MHPKLVGVDGVSKFGIGWAGGEFDAEPGWFFSGLGVVGLGVAEDHDGGGSAGPAFAHIGALGGFADGVEAVLVDVGAEVGVDGPGGEFDAEPGWFFSGLGVVGFGVEDGELHSESCVLSSES